MMTASTGYLESVKKQFAYYKQLGDRTFSQLTEADLFWSYGEETNTIAIIVNHLWGNMMSRWSDFLNSDGEKPWRQRDLEFESVIQTREELIDKWEAGWRCLFEALDTLDQEKLGVMVYIRNMGHTVTEAINRQMAHYAYHVGQIVLLGKMRKGAAWKSLSIPKGASASYNAEKFSQTRRKAHFTDEFIGPHEEE